MYELSYSDYQSRVMAAWLGKSIGGVVGADVENHKELKHLTAAELWPPVIPPNDDLDIQLVWLEAFQELGTWLTSDDLVRYWQDRCWYNFCEYGFFLYNVQRGIRPPLSGYWNNDYFRESEGCPIRSDIWGLVAPGNPALAAEMAKMDGELDHSGFSVEAEMFYAAMTAQALVAKTRDEIIAAGLSVLPPDSRIHEVVRRTARIAADFEDFAAAWRVTVRNYGDRDASKAITNLAFVMLAWFKSNDDFSLAMQHCVNAGWDTDCTAATLGGILGAWKGEAAIPAGWREQLGETLICGLIIDHENARLTDLSVETAKVGAEMALTRNHCVKLTGAPQISVRPQPEPVVTLSVEYVSEPTLFNAASTEVIITAFNPLATAVEGALTVYGPENISVSLEKTTMRLNANGTAAVRAIIQRKNPGSPLQDKNLFTAELSFGTEKVCREFGLGGARQWLVYGPYWDMWDRRRLTVCPYSGPGRNCNPYAVGYGYDSYSHYLDLDRPYLDEAALAQYDLPDESPRHVESGTDLMTEKAMGGWFGPACYYLTRTIIGPEGTKYVLNLTRSGRMRFWLDGKEIPLDATDHVWSGCDRDRPEITMTGKPQRLTVKLLMPYDQGALSINVWRAGEYKQRAGWSYLSDLLADIPPTCGYKY